MAGALADARRASHRPRAVALERRALVGVGLGDLELVADQLVVGLGVGDGRLQDLLPVARGRARGELEDGERLGHGLAADVVADEAGLAGAGADVAGLGADGDGLVAVGRWALGFWLWRRLGLGRFCRLGVRCLVLGLGRLGLRHRLVGLLATGAAPGLGLVLLLA